MANTSMLHVRVDNELKANAAKKLANLGLTVSDAVRILLTRITKEGGMPAGLTMEPKDYDAWFRTKVREALTDPDHVISHQEIMDETQNLINKKRRHV